MATWKGFIKVLVYFVLLLIAACPSWAAHPLITDDTGTQGKGKYQLELNGQYDWDEEEVEGVSIKRKKLTNPKELELGAKALGMPNIIFSHKKHSIWNGCELCHPEIFGVKKGETIYTMQDLFNGKYCGSCHGSVAFPNDDCQRCHTDEV